jgi:predicted P-loop ATPase
MATWIADAQRAGRNVYFQPNETFSNCASKPGKSQIMAGLCRYADIDPADGFPLADERDRLGRLADHLNDDPAYQPTLIIDSGNGIQPFWATAREVLSPFIIARIEAETKAIETALGAGGTHNIDRLLRLPGTMNYPNAAKRAKGRGIGRARLLYSADTIYTGEQAAGLAAHLDATLPPDLVRRKTKPTGPPRPDRDADIAALAVELATAGADGITAKEHLSDELQRRLDAALKARPRLADRWAGLVDDLTEAGRDDSRSAADHSLAAMLKAAKFGHVDAGLILCAFAHGKANGDTWTGDLRLRHVARSVLRSHAPKSKPPRAPLQGWQQYLQLEDGEPIGNLANVLTALRSAPELVGIVAYDLMMRQTLMTRRLTNSRMKGVPDSRPLQDTDVSELQEWIQRNGEMRRIGRETVQQAVDMVAREHAFHPVQDYLNGLHWDGVKRLDTWLKDCLGAETQPKEYLASIGRWWLMSMVARIFEPGCKVDYMVVLEDEEQGTLKSAVCAILGGKWFDDSLPQLHGGDEVRVSQHLRGKWLIEISELSSISKSEANALKSFLSRRCEQYTPKYGRNEVVEPRQVVFVGTTNQTAYLRDESGDRRTWPVKTGTINLDALKAARDQLFAEAVVAYRAGDRYWPDKDFETKHIKPEQDTRHVSDAWEDIIRDWLVGKVKTTVHDVAALALGIETGRLGTADQRRITTALTRCGFVSKRTKAARWWEPGPGEAG